MREQIIKRALEDFIQYGFKTFTMDDLSHKLGMSKKTLYEHFPSKAGLAEACLDRVIEIDRSMDMLEGDGNMIENTFANAYKCQQIYNINSAKPIWELKKYYPKLHEKMEQYFWNHDREVVKQLLQRGKAEGLFHEHINEKFYGYFYSMVQRLRTLTDNFPEEQFGFWEIVITTIEYCFRILVNEKGLSVLERVLTNYRVNNTI